MFLFLLIFASCKDYAPYDLGGQDTETIFNGLMQEAIDNSHNNTPGVGISVNCPPKDINFIGVKGFDSKDKSSSLEADQPFFVLHQLPKLL